MCHRRSGKKNNYKHDIKAKYYSTVLDSNPGVIY